MPKIISSAIKVKPNGCDYYQILCGKHHWQIQEVVNKLFKLASYEYGFMTDEDQFVNVCDAYLMAVQAGQIEGEMYFNVPLRSEDIF